MSGAGWIVVVAAALVVAVPLLLPYLNRLRSRPWREPGEEGGNRVADPKDFENVAGVRITPHFNSSEFASPDTGEVHIHKGLVGQLEAFRDAAGKRRVLVGSGYRTIEHNKAVGGVSNSFHIKGMAADISIPGFQMAALHNLALVYWYTGRIGGLGLYDWGVHLDVGPVRYWDGRSSR